jgi:hypothetical protein
MQARMRADLRPCYPLAVLVGMAMGLGCWQRAERHCSNLEGDATCAERGVGSFCDACRADVDGCTWEQPSQECHFAGAEQASASVGSTDAGSTAEAATAEGSGPTTTEAAQCTSDEDCEDPVAPFCAPDGECVGCDAMPQADAACTGRDETKPLCVDGECVQCSAANAGECDATLQVCDSETHACTGCAAHEQCRSGACELAEGRCFPLDVAVLDVHGDGGAGYPNVGVAVADVDDGARAIIRLHELDDGDAYRGAPVIGGGKIIALLGAPGEDPALEGMLAGFPALRVQGSGTTVYIDRIWLRDTAAGRGLVVSEGAAWVDRSRIVRNAEGGVLAEAGASVTIRSSFVGGGVDDVAAVEVTGATARIGYATLGGGSGNARALVCNATASVDVRNSVLVARTGAPEVSCDEGTFEHDAAEHELGGTNTALPPMSTTWFMDYEMGALGLTPVGAEVFADIARWERGDPRTDIDGDARPTVDGAPDYAGADVP